MISETSTPELVLNNVRKTYETPSGPLEVLRDVSAIIQPGETVAIIGPSGSGKSTLLNIIGSLDKPTSGSVELGTIRVDSLSGEELARFRAADVGFIFQEHHLLPQLTAIENTLIPTVALHDNEESAEKRARELLEYLGVADRANAFPVQMSGGERQRIAIARAMINEPAILLCDEPTGNLDQTTAVKTVALFLDLARMKNTTVVFVTHNLGLAERFNRKLELRNGTLVEQEADQHFSTSIQ